MSLRSILLLAGAAFPDAPRLEAVDAIVARAVRADAPGAVVAVERDGKILHLAAYGLAESGKETPLAPGSRFLVASTSKAITAACVALLARDGALSLDDDVRRFLPDLPDVGGTVTVRDLLHHRSGIRDFYELLVLAGKRFEVDLAPEEVLRLLRRQKALNFAPGTRALYSNSGYFLLGRIVERASGGKSLRSFADERLFRPLGMTRTSFRDDRSEAFDGLVPGHDRTEGGYRVRPPPPALVGPGGLVTTAADLLRFAAAAGKGGALADLHLDAPPPLGPAVGRDPLLGHYAFGCLTGTRQGLRVAMSPGGSFGYQSQLLCVPASGLTVVLLSNASDVRAVDLSLEIAAAVLGTAPTLPPAGAGPPVPPPPGFHVFRDDARGDLLVLSSRDGTGRLATLGWKATLAPAGGRAFVATDSLIPVAFRWEPREDGTPATALLEIEGEEPRRWTALPPMAATPGAVAACLGEYESEEVGASIRLVEKRGRVAIDDAGLAMPVPPFLFASETLLLSDAPASIELERGEGGRVTALRLSTGRARNLRFTRKP